ncbi:hypothetical protein E1B28_009303 [Marasmius oreades]|uniref:Uncharacterized protein n=1 Tax=Marasmius oreades TaxID=181124 RepID=A0A9P7UV65_9AGAR|nr:uncharacterized protein E1B28_009303 [Marasmius oreades]KAG7093004.1 hypothetical protein E1B28_009303 [Marasmius oreades]
MTSTAAPADRPRPRATCPEPQRGAQGCFVPRCDIQMGGQGGDLEDEIAGSDSPSTTGDEDDIDQFSNRQTLQPPTMNVVDDDPTEGARDGGAFSTQVGTATLSAKPTGSALSDSPPGTIRGPTSSGSRRIQPALARSVGSPSVSPPRFSRLEKAKGKELPTHTNLLVAQLHRGMPPTGIPTSADPLTAENGRLHEASGADPCLDRILHDQRTVNPHTKTCLEPAPELVVDSNKRHRRRRRKRSPSSSSSSSNSSDSESDTSPRSKKLKLAILDPLTAQTVVLPSSGMSHIHIAVVHCLSSGWSWPISLCLFAPAFKGKLANPSGSDTKSLFKQLNSFPISSLNRGDFHDVALHFPNAVERYFIPRDGRSTGSTLALNLAKMFRGLFDLLRSRPDFTEFFDTYKEYLQAAMDQWYVRRSSEAIRLDIWDDSLWATVQDRRPLALFSLGSFQTSSIAPPVYKSSASAPLRGKTPYFCWIGGSRCTHDFG